MAPDSTSIAVSSMSKKRERPPPFFFKGRSALNNSRHIQITGLNSYRVGGEVVSLKPPPRKPSETKERDAVDPSEWKKLLHDTPVEEKHVETKRKESMREIVLRKELIRRIAQREALEDYLTEFAEEYAPKKKFKTRHGKLKKHKSLVGPAIINQLVEVLMNELEISNEDELSYALENEVITELIEDTVDQIEKKYIDPIAEEDESENISSVDIVEVLLPIDKKKSKNRDIYFSVVIDKRFEEIEAFFTLGAKPLPYPGPSASFTFYLEPNKSESSSTVFSPQIEKTYSSVEVEETVCISTRRSQREMALEEDPDET